MIPLLRQHEWKPSVVWSIRHPHTYAPTSLPMNEIRWLIYHLTLFTIERIWYSNPISNIRSASSSMT